MTQSRKERDEDSLVRRFREKGEKAKRAKRKRMDK